MSIKRIFIVISAIFAASAVFADNSSVTSKKYVDDLMSGYQGKLPGSGANKLMIYDDETGIGEKSIETTLVSNATGVPTVGAVKTGLDGKQDTITGTAGCVMTGTGNAGEVGERAIYSANTNYSDSLVTAETVNTGVINAVNSSLIRVNEQGAPSDSGTLWEINTSLFALDVRLPLRYRQVEWLRSTKGLIITGFKTKDTQNIKAKWMRVSNYAQYVYFSDAASSGTTNTTAYVTGTSSSGGNWRFGGATQPLTFSSNVLYETVQNKNGVWANNAQIAEYEDVSSFTSSNDLNILGAASTSPIRLYSLQIEENGIKTLDIIPVQDVTENTYGVYDLVNGIFYTDAGATFTAGPICVSPNLFDKTNGEYINAYVHADTGMITQGTTQYCFVVPVQPNTTYVLSGMSSASTWGAFPNKTVGTTATTKMAGNGSITTGPNDRYLIGMAYATGTQYDYRDTLQVELGSTATTYRPYGENICD